jgi:hypothetical protein
LNNNTGAVVGVGTVDGNVVNRGKVEPGKSSDSSGVMTIAGDYTQESDGQLIIEVNGTTAGSGYDQLAVGGDIALDGIVEVNFAQSFVPQVGDRFDVITTAEPVSGKFANPSLPGLPAGMKWGITYGANAVSLAIGIPGDYNADGHVDAGDYVTWRNTLGDSGKFLAADGDGDEEIDIGDYAFWKLHYGDPNGGVGGLATFSGSPNPLSPSDAAVPEPTAAGLCGLAIVSLLGLRNVCFAIRTDRSRAFMIVALTTRQFRCSSCETLPCVESSGTNP